MSYVEALKAATREHWVNYERQEKEEKERILREAKELAKELIAELPRILREASNKGRSSVFVLEFSRYPPWSFQWGTDFNERRKLAHPLTKYWVRRYIRGVPGYIARWALSQGLTVRIGDGNVSHPFRMPRRTLDGYNWQQQKHQGLIISW